MLPQETFELHAWPERPILGGISCMQVAIAVKGHTYCHLYSFTHVIYVFIIRPNPHSDYYCYKRCYSRTKDNRPMHASVVYIAASLYHLYFVISYTGSTPAR